MGILERERKFLVSDPAFLHGQTATRIAQVYVAIGDKVEVRVRHARDDFYTMTVKAGGAQYERIEEEFAIDAQLADACFKNSSLVIRKDRFSVLEDGHAWDVDVFHDENFGLVLAELESDDALSVVELPQWCGTEVTGEARFYNNVLARRPIKMWSAEERRKWGLGD